VDGIQVWKVPGTSQRMYGSGLITTLTWATAGLRRRVIARVEAPAVVERDSDTSGRAECDADK
jgi:hypothetical protein